MQLLCTLSAVKIGRNESLGRTHEKNARRGELPRMKRASAQGEHDTGAERRAAVTKKLLSEVPRTTTLDY